VVRLAVVTLLALGVARPAPADLLQDLGATFQEAAQDLAGAFPKVEVKIAAVEADRVRLEGPGLERLRPGLELVAYRRGERFRHPVTNQPLGWSELEVATLSITEVASDHALARVVATEGDRRPGPGDGARITAGRMPVAVLPTEGVQAPFESADQTAILLVTRFSGLLEKTGRFLAVDPAKVLAALGPPGGRGPAPGALEVARQIRAPAVLTSRLVQEGRARSLEVAWVSGRSGETLVTLRRPLARAVYPPRFAWEQTPELERRYPLEGPVRGLALADVDGDGRAELVLADDETVTAHRWQETGLGAVLGPGLRPGGTILALDAADVAGRGRAQAVIVTQRGGSGREAIRSQVVEWDGAEIRTLYQTAGRFLRVVRVGGESWLLEQDGGEEAPYTGAIRRLVWEDGRFRDGPTLRVPPGISVFGLALVRLTGGDEPDVVAVTPEDRLVAWSAGGQRLWVGPTPYGGSAFTFPYTGNVGEGRSRPSEEAQMGRVVGRVVTLGGGEAPEILVYENALPAVEQVRTVLPRLTATLVNQGRVHRLQWRDGAFVRVWQSATTAGYIADFAYGDLDGDGVPEVVLGVVPRGLDLDTLNPFSRTRGFLAFYELP
jgi:hypothetical protein